MIKIEPQEVLLRLILLTIMMMPKNRGAIKLFFVNMTVQTMLKCGWCYRSYKYVHIQILRPHTETQSTKVTLMILLFCS